MSLKQCLAIYEWNKWKSKKSCVYYFIVNCWKFHMGALMASSSFKTVIEVTYFYEYIIFHINNYLISEVITTMPVAYITYAKLYMDKLKSDTSFICSTGL